MTATCGHGYWTGQCRHFHLPSQKVLPESAALDSFFFFNHIFRHFDPFLNVKWLLCRVNALMSHLLNPITKHFNVIAELLSTKLKVNLERSNSKKEKRKKISQFQESLSQILLTLQSPEEYQELFSHFPFLKIMVKTHNVRSTLSTM